MKKAILIISSIFFLISLKAQNIECIGNTINIPLSGYKAGKIQWQFSSDKNTWINLAGQITTNFQYTITGTGYFRAKITYGQCDYFSDTTFVQTYPTPTIPNAGSDKTITNTDTTVILSANMPTIGKGKWSIISGTGGVFANDTLPNTTFKGKACNNYLLRWTISTGCMSKTDDVNISFHETPTIANAGIDQTINTGDTIVALSANMPAAGRGKWAIVSGTGGSFVNDTLATTTFKGRKFIYYNLKWTISTKCSQSSDDVIVLFMGNSVDIENNNYRTVKIGNQIWMAEDLRTSKYQNGEAIGTTNPATLNISGEKTPKYQWSYGGNESHVPTYGRLYTWYVVMDSRGVCPIGWHVPTDAEWAILVNSIGGRSVAGGKIKETGTLHWQSPNAGATDETGFTALPSGIRFGDDGIFRHIGYYNGWWSVTEKTNDEAYAWGLYFDYGSVAWMNDMKKNNGCSVRCIKD